MQLVTLQVRNNVCLTYLSVLSFRPRPPTAYGDSSTVELYASFWEYVEQLHDNSMMFYNFFYQPKDDPVSHMTVM